MANDTTITFIGNLTADPELTFPKDGHLAVTNFTVANTARTFDRTTNQWIDGQTTFLKCGAFRDLAEHVAESLRKGMRVIVSGRLRQHHWETKEGEKRSMFVLDVDEIGASLKWATVTVTKAARTNTNSGGTAGSADVDPWAGNAPAGAPVGAGVGGSEPPF